MLSYRRNIRDFLFWDSSVGDTSSWYRLVSTSEAGVLVRKFSQLTQLSSVKRANPRYFIALGTIAPDYVDRQKCGECGAAGEALMNRRIADGKIIFNTAAIFYFISSVRNLRNSFLVFLIMEYS